MATLILLIMMLKKNREKMDNTIFLLFIHITPNKYFLDLFYKYTDGCIEVFIEGYYVVLTDQNTNITMFVFLY